MAFTHERVAGSGTKKPRMAKRRMNACQRGGCLLLSKGVTGGRCGEGRVPRLEYDAEGHGPRTDVLEGDSWWANEAARKEAGNNRSRNQVALQPRAASRSAATWPSQGCYPRWCGPGSRK